MTTGISMNLLCIWNLHVFLDVVQSYTKNVHIIDIFGLELKDFVIKTCRYINQVLCLAYEVHCFCFTKVHPLVACYATSKHLAVGSAELSYSVWKWLRQEVHQPQWLKTTKSLQSSKMEEMEVFRPYLWEDYLWWWWYLVSHYLMFDFRLVSVAKDSLSQENC